MADKSDGVHPDKRTRTAKGTPRKVHVDKQSHKKAAAPRVAKIPKASKKSVNKKTDTLSEGTNKHKIHKEKTGEEAKPSSPFKFLVKGILLFFGALASAIRSIKTFIAHDPHAAQKKKGPGFFKKSANLLRNNFIFFAIVLVLIAGTFTALYFPAKDYYVAYRENQRLQDEYLENIQRNKDLEAKVKDLQTLEGIEDKAREDLNMVLPGENSVNVVGLPEETKTAQPAAVTARVPEGSGTAPESWQTRFLDFFFGVGDTSKGSIPQKEEEK
ncbi:MAG: septum formation initiator family protein [Coriobacteriia bacterium]|nr:septum formation initiator family protein [Coriobacteriia bacterium]